MTYRRWLFGLCYGAAFVFWSLASGQLIFWRVGIYHPKLALVAAVLAAAVLVIGALVERSRPTSKSGNKDGDLKDVLAIALVLTMMAADRFLETEGHRALAGIAVGLMLAAAVFLLRHRWRSPRKQFKTPAAL